MAANRLEFSTYLNPAGFKRGIAEMEALSSASGARMGSALAGGFGHGGGPGGGISGIIRESLVLVREFGRGNHTRMAGSATLLAQYSGAFRAFIKSTASASIAEATASKALTANMALEAAVAMDVAKAKEAAAYAANLDDAALNAESDAAALNANTLRAAAIAQGEKSAADERAAAVAMSSARVTITALGWIVIVAAALAVPLFMVYRHYSKLNAEHQKFLANTDATRSDWLAEAKAIQENAKSREELTRWMNKELDNRKSLQEITERQLKTLHEEAEAQRALARAKGESMSVINAMEATELRQEIQLLQVAKAKADADVIAAQSRLNDLRGSMTNNPSLATPEGNVDLVTVKQKMDQAADYIKKITDSIDTDPALNFIKSIILQRKGNGNLSLADAAGFVFKHPIATPGLASLVRENPNATLNELVSKRTAALSGEEGIKSFGSTLDNARSTYEKLNGYLNTLNGKLDEQTNKIDDQKTALTDSITAQRKYTDQLAEDSAQLKIKTGVAAQTAALEDAKKGLSKLGGGGSDSLVKIGNFLGSARSGIESMTAEMVRLARSSNGHLANIDNHLRRNGGSGAGNFSF